MYKCVPIYISHTQSYKHTLFKMLLCPPSLPPCQHFESPGIRELLNHLVHNSGLDPFLPWQLLWLLTASAFSAFCSAPIIMHAVWSHSSISFFRWGKEQNEEIQFFVLCLQFFFSLSSIFIGFPFGWLVILDIRFSIEIYILLSHILFMVTIYISHSEQI